MRAGDGVALDGRSWLGVIGCTACATVGVVLLSRERQGGTAVPANRQPRDATADLLSELG